MCENHKCNECCHEHGEEGVSWKSQTFSLTMLIAGIVINVIGLSFFTQWVPPVWYAVAYLPVAWPVAKEAWVSLKEADVCNEFSLMLIASLGAFAIGEYPEAVAVMLFYSIGESLQDRAVDRARDNIKALINLCPETVAVERDGRVCDVAPDDVAVGETILIAPGGRMPLDCVLTEQSAEFDTSALTGESAPRTINEGSEVLAGMISVQRAVRLKVVRPAADSAMARIMHMVEDASERKSPTELFIRRFAKIYTPVVTLMAVALVVIPLLVSLVAPFNYVFSDWLYRGLVFLVVSCPCALVVSIPLSYFAGIGTASRRGILFKGGGFIDTVAKIKTMAFDKTGTLTKGVFSVTEIQAVGVDDNRLLQLVAAAESASTHPIATTVCREAARCGLESLVASNIKEIAGCGICANVDGSDVLVGNARLLNKFSVDYPAEMDDITGTMVCCAVDGSYCGYLILSDVLKDGAIETVSRLHGLGVERIAILSGDKQSIVTQMGRAIGADVAVGDLMPADKVARFEAMKCDAQGAAAYVGDGINDAPALAVSDVGFAMGALGSDAAIETADVVIETDQPERIADAVVIAKKTRSIVRQNIVFALGVKAVVLLLGAVGITNMWMAVFADVGVTLLAVANALRLNLISHKY